MRTLLPLFVLLPALNDVPAERVDIRGEVKLHARAEKNDRAILGHILVEAPFYLNSVHDKATVTITASTKITHKIGQEHKPVRFEDLKVGTFVEVQFTGPLAESYPISARADHVVILEPVLLAR